MKEVEESISKYKKIVFEGEERKIKEKIEEVDGGKEFLIKGGD